MDHLAMSDEDRERLKDHLAEDRFQEEILIGLSRAESEQFLWLKSVPHRQSSDRDHLRYLEERHDRAMHFWRISHSLDRPGTAQMTAEEAFDRGYKAWPAYAGARQNDDFAAMIKQIPSEHRLFALNGWLTAFDDEEDRLRRS